MDPASKAFLHRLGRINDAIHESGSRVLARVVETCKQMLADRGCGEVRASKQLLDDMAAGRPALVGNGHRGRWVIYLLMEDKVSVKFARGLAECDDGNRLCVSIDGPTPFSRREYEDVIQFMTYKQLQTNVSTHCLVPKHEVAAQHDHDVAKLPKILTTDEVVQYYNWPVGTVVAIRRVAGGGEPLTYFRVVTAA